MAMLIDSHTHLDSLEDLDGAIAEARAVGIEWIISIGTSIESIKRTLAIAEQHPDLVRVGVGIHPNSAGEFDLSDWPHVVELANHPLVCAIGETGFDQFHKRATLEQQDVLFELHVELATALGYPLVIHSRNIERHTLDRLAQAAPKLGGGEAIILHCFSMPDHIDEILATDYILSFAGNVTYGSAAALRSAAVVTPADRIMVETDAPYLTPVPHRGKPNHPALVAHTLECVATARDVSDDTMRALTSANALRVFGLS